MSGWTNHKGIHPQAPTQSSEPNKLKTTIFERSGLTFVVCITKHYWFEKHATNLGKAYNYYWHLHNKNY